MVFRHDDSIIASNPFSNFQLHGQQDDSIMVFQPSLWFLDVMIQSLLLTLSMAFRHDDSIVAPNPLYDFQTG